MTRVSYVFWNNNEQRLRAPWRLILFLLLVSAIANPLILLLDATDNRFLETTFENVFVALGFVLALAVSARFFEHHPLKQYGLSLQRLWFGELGIGFALGGAIMALVLTPQYFAGWIVVEDTLQTTIPATPFVLAFAGQILRYFGGSFFEELFSRSYLLRLTAETIRGSRIQREGAVLIAAAATAFLFGLLHMFNPGASLVSVVNLTMLGLLFALPMIVTGRLALSIGLHMGWNVFQSMVCGLHNSGIPSNTSLLVIQLAGPTIWTGGSFGPEGGLVAFLVILIAFIFVAAWLQIGNHTLRIDGSLADPPTRESSVFHQ